MRVSRQAMRTRSPVGRVVGPLVVMSRWPFSVPASTLTATLVGPSADAQRPASAHARQIELSPPPRQQRGPQRAVLRVKELRVARDQRLGVLAGPLEDGRVADQVGDAELGKP